MSDFCDEAWDPTAELRAAVHDLPFNTEPGSCRRVRQYEYLFWDGAYHRRVWPPPRPT